MEYKFRVWCKNNREWEKDTCVLTPNGKLIHQSAKGPLVPLRPDTHIVSMFTGLYDSTKWEQLTQEERKEFYHKNNSEDGETIKYQHIDDVKHLWKGREIWEGDVVLATLKYFDIINEKCKVIFHNGSFGVQYGFSTDYFKSFAAWDEVTVIGDVWQNPELLEGRK